MTFSLEERANNTNTATGPGHPTATIRHRTGWPPVSPAALLSARERRSEYGCLWTGQENGSGVLYFILTWSEARGQHRLGAALLRFPMICGRRILFLIRRFYREINGKGTGTIDHELGTKEEPLVIRLFMASSRTFRKKRDTQFNVDNKEIQDYYNMTVFPKFVWVCEISSKALYENQQVLGEIIIDATSSPDAKMDSIIIVNYPYALCRRMPEDFLKASEACFEEVKEWKPYDIFRGNLTDCQSL